MASQAIDATADTASAPHRNLAQHLDRLYQAALTEMVDKFPVCVIRLLLETIGIEGAILRITSGYPHQLHLATGQESRYGVITCGEGIAETMFDDAVASCLRRYPPAHSMNCADAVPDAVPGAFASFVRREQIRHLLLHGTFSVAGLDWILLYRRVGNRFTQEQASCIQALLPHIVRCIEINQRSVLDGLDGRRNNRRSALIDESGAIKAADPGFVALLQQEWPACRGITIPTRVYLQLVAGKAFLGRAIQIEATRSSGQIVFYAKKNLGSARLTPAEQEVANRFAIGMSTKKIAAELGVSPNTVRTQLSHLYSKLDVHDKAQLAQRLMAV